ncbi:hypothetical protein BH23DEI1_BH23DEI1_20230 [soil metagenome]
MTAGTPWYRAAVEDLTTEALPQEYAQKLIDEHGAAPAAPARTSRPTETAATLALGAARSAAAGDVAGYVAAAELAVAACSADGDPTRLAGALVEAGNAARMAGAHQRALELLARAIAVPGLDDATDSHTPILATAHHRMAIVYDAMGDAATALSHLREAESAYVHIDDRPGLARVRNSLGIIYSRTGDLERALEFFGACVAEAERVRDAERLSAGLSNISITTRLLGRYDEAVANAERATSIAAEHGERSSMASSRSNLALAYAAAGRSDEARVAFEDARSLHEALGDRFFLAEHLRAYSEFLAAQDETSSALEQAHASLALAVDIDALALVRDGHEALAGLHKRRGEFGLALEHFERHHEMSVRLDAEAAARDLRTQKWQYELDQAQRATDVARAERATLASGYARLEALHELLARQTRELEARSRIDDLTRIANRGAFEERLHEESARAARQMTPFALVFVDLDAFKAVNDTFGHGVGDDVLRIVGDVLRRAVRETDCAARMGGEEFAVLLTGTSGAGAVRVAEKLRTAIAHHPWHALRPGLRITASFGAATSDEVDADPTRLLELADARLYHAKAAGRDRVVATAPTLAALE